MTLILNDVYGYTFKGFVAFVLNRFLRLFPIYWAFLIFSVLLVVFTGEKFSANFRECIYFPDSSNLWLYNIFMVYPDLFPWNIEPRLCPPTWALTIEFLFYALIAFGISKTPKVSLCWLIISICYSVLNYVFMLDFSSGYGSVLAGSLPFSIGACLFHYHGYMTFLKKFIVNKWLLI